MNADENNIKDKIPFTTLGIQHSTNQDPSRFETCYLKPIPNTTCTREVRSVHSGGTFFVVRLWTKQLVSIEELYVKYSTPKPNNSSPYFKSLANGNQEDFNPFHLIDYKEAIDKLEFGTCYEVKNIYCTQALIILHMKNDLIVGLEVNSGALTYIDRFMKENIGIKEVVVGPLSLHILVYGSDNIMRYFNIDGSSFSENPALSMTFTSEIKYVMSALSGRSSFIVYELKDKSHHIRSNGDDQFSSQNGQPSTACFNELQTPFLGKRISLMKCGYFHTCVMLENSDVYMCGYNAYSQCGVHGRDQHFIKLDFPSFPLENRENGEKLYEGNTQSCHFFEPSRVICSSIATTFVNQHGFILVGDPVTSYITKHIFKKDVTRGVDCLYHSFGREDGGFESNMVECGGWHIVVYNKKATESKCLKYIYENLKKSVANPAFSDINLFQSSTIDQQ